MAVTTTKWDTAEFLTNEEEIAAYLEAALEDGDPALIELARKNVERARERMARKSRGDQVGN